MASDFAAALRRGDMDAVRRAPKADLHIHAYGGGDRAFVRERTGVDIAPVDRVLRSMTEMHAFAEERLSPAFVGLEGRALALEATFVQARQDGMTRLEVGEDAWGVTLHDGAVSPTATCLRSGAARPNPSWPYPAIVRQKGSGGSLRRGTAPALPRLRYREVHFG